MTAAMTEVDVMAAVRVAKTYGGTHALKGVSLGIRSGRVTALFGENGAGKSTLMKILAGIETPTIGSIELNGEVVEFESPREAADTGVVIIHQELSLCPNLSIQDNLFLGREIRTRVRCGRSTSTARSGQGGPGQAGGEPRSRQRGWAIYASASSSWSRSPGR